MKRQFQSSVTESRSMIVWSWGWGDRLDWEASPGSVLSDENVLCLDNAGNYLAVYISQNSLKYTLNRDAFYINY